MYKSVFTMHKSVYNVQKCFHKKKSDTKFVKYDGAEYKYASKPMLACTWSLEH